MSSFTCEQCGQEISNAVVRKEYLKRLIEGVRGQMAEDPATIQAKADYGEDVTIGKWLDAALLCAVVEEDIINNPDIGE